MTNGFTRTHDDAQALQAPAMSRRCRGTGSHGLLLVALVAVTAGTGCSAPPDDIPFTPCRVETVDSRDQLRSYERRGYDEAGNHAWTQYHDADGTSDARHDWQYRSDGRLTRATQQFPGGFTSVSFEYGIADRLESVTWASSREHGRVDYEYPDARRVIERWDDGDDGTVEQTRTYTYDPEGKLEGHTVVCGDAEDPVERVTMQWSQDDHLERIELHRNDVLVSFSDYSYNEDGLRSGMEYSFESEFVSYRYSETYEFDADGYVSARRSRSSQSGPDYTSSNTYEAFDPAGRILTEQIEGPGGLSEKIYVYECPASEDTPGRRLATPEPVARLPWQGPRDPVTPDAVSLFSGGDDRCWVGFSARAGL